MMVKSRCFDLIENYQKEYVFILETARKNESLWEKHTFDGLFFIFGVCFIFFKYADQIPNTKFLVARMDGHHFSKLTKNLKKQQKTAPGPENL